MKPEIKPGIVVFSQKGRDKGRLFVVLYQMDADFVSICDGLTHPIEKPKKKRRKHVKPIGFEFPELIKLYEQNRLQNSDVKKALKPLIDSQP
jgi:ribosomal protein L14E/L6E/L27E